MSDKHANEEQIQSLVSILSLIAILGRMEKTAMQRVVVSLGSSLFETAEGPEIDVEVARRLIAFVVKEKGEQVAMNMVADLNFVAHSWEPVLKQFFAEDPYRLMPFAEIAFLLVNHSGETLQRYEAFELFGGSDVVLPMRQLTAALRPYPMPVDALDWKFIGFNAPADQALVASSEQTLYLFKSAPSGIDVRFSELERNSENGPRREHDVRMDTPTFAAFMAGMLGDMLYWAARLRGHALPSQELWRRIQTLLLPTQGQ